MINRNFRTICHIVAISIFLFISNAVFSQENWFKAGSVPQEYANFIDSSNQHEGRNVMTLKSVNTDISGFGALMQNMKPGKYLGKRIRMTGYLKSKDITGWAGFWLRVDQAGSQEFLSFDNMQDRPIKGTTEWTKYEIVLDVPGDASNIAFGTLLSNSGQIWIDNVDFEMVDNTVPPTGQKKQD